MYHTNEQYNKIVALECALGLRGNQTRVLYLKLLMSSPGLLYLHRLWSNCIVELSTHSSKSAPPQLKQKILQRISELPKDTK